MLFTVLTLFPGMLRPFVRHSLVGKAVASGRVGVKLVDFRRFAKDKRRTVDGYQIGGGPGMVIMAEPVARALERHKAKGARTVLLSPQGKPFTQAKARELAAAEADLVLVCGHYEGFDERLSPFFDEEISLGDYVTMGGEVAAAVVIEAVVRLLPGVINEHSLARESHDALLLDHPVYAKPVVWRGVSVPEVLMSGHHAMIAAHRLAESERVTRTKRPDLYEKYVQSKGLEYEKARRPGAARPRRAGPT